MLIITKYPDKYKNLQKKYGEVVDVVDYKVLYHDSGRIATEQGQHCFRELEGTASGPCLVVGMGTSREKAKGLDIRVPVFAINRAILDFPKAQYWCAHDLDSVSECLDSVSADTVLLTYSCNFRKGGWAKVKEKGIKVYFIEMFADPRRHAKRPLYWNQTTVGWTWDLAIRMGHGPVYNIGIDRSVASYNNPHFPERELAAQHIGVQDRVKAMFQPSEFGAWNSKNAKLIDLSDNGYLPVEKGDVRQIS